MNEICTLAYAGWQIEASKLLHLPGKPAGVGFLSLWCSSCRICFTCRTSRQGSPGNDAIVSNYRRISVLAFDGRAATEYQWLQRSRIRIGTMDLKIAAIVLAHDATLLSRDLADFHKVPEPRIRYPVWSCSGAAPFASYRPISFRWLACQDFTGTNPEGLR